MNIDIKRIMTENTLVGLTIPSGWTIRCNNLLCMDLTLLDPNDLHQVVDTYYDYQVFGAIFSGSNRAPKHDFYIFVHCSLLDRNDYLKGFNYELSYLLVPKNQKSSKFSEQKYFSSLEDLISNLNKLLIKVHYDIDIIIKNKFVDL